jgi:hypothetical protein
MPHPAPTAWDALALTVPKNGIVQDSLALNISSKKCCLLTFREVVMTGSVGGQCEKCQI